MVHIVDTLIEERAERLRNHPRVWQWVQRNLYPILGYDEAVSLIDFVQNLSGFEVFEHISQTLNMRVTVDGGDNIPKTGRAVIMPNHPAGIADGIAVFDALKEVRPDVAFFANRDAVRCHERMNEILIPIEWMEQRRSHAKTKETVRNMVQAFRDERLVVIFASGRLARPTPIGLIERPWLASGVGLAQKYKCPIVPMHVTGHNSALYYLLWFLNTELKDMTLFRELLNKTNQKYHIRIGEPVLSNEHPETLTPALREFVTKELKYGHTAFQAIDN
ncbi:MAG: acyltransferase [Pseudomonadales bacterium]|nr:acyltransferase [Pseudomonadales bacterium]